jgi:hypothetical protein
MNSRINPYYYCDYYLVVILSKKGTYVKGLGAPPSGLEPDMALQSRPARASWASGLVADEQAQHQQLFVGASNNAHEGQPAQPTDDGPSTLAHGTDPSPTIVASPSVQPTSVEDFIASLKLSLEKPRMWMCRAAVIDLLPSPSTTTRTRRSRPSGSCSANGSHR